MAHRPHPILALLEVRAAPEFGAFAASIPAMKALLPRGNEDRHVLVLPGFMAGDGSTKPLRALLDRLGHQTHGWGLGRNIGPTTDILEGMIVLVERLALDKGPIDIVGWSLGGLYGREIARLHPGAVRQVITLGSPFQTIGPEESNAKEAFAALRHRHSDETKIPRVPSWAREPLTVPATSIYTKGDGIVSWHQCLNRALPRTENVEVYGSHCGLGHNPAAIWVIADRLAQRGVEWAPFRPRRVLRALYPNADVLDTDRVGAA
ncbi:MAG: alpha/beta fold hydrolase [Acidimicrobiales bacterium]